MIELLKKELVLAFKLIDIVDIEISSLSICLPSGIVIRIS